MNEKTCPMCGETLLFLYGCGWDYDRLICGNRNCDYEEELKTISYPKEVKK